MNVSERINVLAESSALLLDHLRDLCVPLAALGLPAEGGEAEPPPPPAAAPPLHLGHRRPRHGRLAELGRASVAAKVIEEAAERLVTLRILKI